MVGSVAVTVFLGGWLRPFPNVAWLAVPMDYGGPLALFALVIVLFCARKMKLRLE